MQDIPWSPIRSILSAEFGTVGLIKEIVGYGNIDMGQLDIWIQKNGVAGSSQSSQLLSAIDAQVYEMDDQKKRDFVRICCEEMCEKNPWIKEKLEIVLSNVGWQFSLKGILPIEIFDLSELDDIPAESHEDILMAATRLRDGDLSGAVSAACGALDSATNRVYEKFDHLDDPNDDSFKTRIDRSLKAVDIEGKLESELQQIGCGEDDRKKTVKNLKGSLSQAAFVMQTLRSRMGDVHGTKPAISALTFDSIKWSLLLLRFLNVH